MQGLVKPILALIPDQQQFRSLLIQAYSPQELAPNKEALRCLVSKVWHSKLSIHATHIVPYAIGEVNASYVFGLRPEEGYKAIWEQKNGLLLHGSIEAVLDAAQVVIVPIEESSNEAKTPVLDDSLLGEHACFPGPTYTDIHNAKVRVPLRFSTWEKTSLFPLPDELVSSGSGMGFEAERWIKQRSKWARFGERLVNG